MGLRKIYIRATNELAIIMANSGRIEEAKPLLEAIVNEHTEIQSQYKTAVLNGEIDQSKADEEVKELPDILSIKYKVVVQLTIS